MVDKKKYPDRKVLEKEAEKHFDEKKLVRLMKSKQSIRLNR